VKKIGTFWHYSSVNIACSNTQFCHQFGTNLAVRNDSVVDGIVENLALFVSAFGIFLAI